MSSNDDLKRQQEEAARRQQEENARRQQQELERINDERRREQALNEELRKGRPTDFRPKKD